MWCEDTCGGWYTKVVGGERSLAKQAGAARTSSILRRFLLKIDNSPFYRDLNGRLLESFFCAYCCDHSPQRLDAGQDWAFGLWYTEVSTVAAAVETGHIRSVADTPL